MASVYEKRGTWYVNIKDATGRRRNIATKATTKTEARRLAADLERQGERARFGLEPLPSDSTMTLGQLCEWWLDERCPEASRPDERLRLGRHVLASPLGAVLLRFVTPALLDDQLRAMERAGAAPASVNKLRAVLHTVYSRARKAGRWTGANPVELVEVRRVPRRAYATLRAEEVPVLLANVPEDWRGLFAAALYTGMRKGELCGLRKSDVDLASGTLTVARSYDRETTKGGHADSLPVPAPLWPYLRDALDGPGDLVFPADGGGMRSDESDPQKVLRHALGRAGIVLGYDHVCRRCKARHVEPNSWRHQDQVERKCERCGMRLWPKALPRPLRFHDLRHTTATLLLRAGVDAHRVQRILRHRDVRTTTSIYGHLDVEDLRSAMASLPGASEASTEPSTAPASATVPVAALGASRGRRSTRLLPDATAPQRKGPGPVDFSKSSRPVPEWAMQVSNLRPLPCEGSALPLS